VIDRQHRLLRIASIFEEAIDLAPQEQARIMDRECGSDMKLRHEVQRLLDADVTEPPHVAFLHPAGRLTELEPAAATGDAASPDTQTLNDAAAGVMLGNEPRRCAITIGSRIGSYRIVEQLGAGGMGAVFLARHEKLRHDAVVKVLLPHAMASSSGSMQRFEREAQMAAAISHPGVVQVMDSGRHESGERFILMERLHGESLRDRLLSARKLPPRTAISFAIQTARVLEAVHVHCVHRDLKPDNLFLVPDPEVPGGERVKLLDFGIAKPLNPLNKLTFGFTAMGTPPYMAPEQYINAAGVDARADLYSMGVLLFQMLCGQLPFQCESFGEYRAAHMQRRPPSVGRYTGVSPGLSDVVARLLAKRPKDRLPSARALVEALAALPEMQGACLSESELITHRVVHEQAIHTEMTRLPGQVETGPALRRPRARRENADASSALPLYTEPQVMSPETVEPRHESACLAPGDTAPAITVAPDMIVDTASRMAGARVTKRMWRP
jgi:serine/threonine protein kinase